MQKLQLIRIQESDHGTFGEVVFDGARLCYMAELPGRANQQNISCIPAGRYQCIWHRSPRFGWLYTLLGVPGRSNVHIHHGNFAGDVSQGLKTHSAGCLLPGSRRGWLQGQQVVLASRFARTKLEGLFDKQPFELDIVEGWK